jgi:hypothetical protein
LPGLGAALLVVAFCRDLPWTVTGYHGVIHTIVTFSRHIAPSFTGIDTMKVSAFVVVLMHYAAAQTLCLPNCRMANASLKLLFDAPLVD